jgi:membrane protease YdiL (CAAX protease family)
MLVYLGYLFPRLERVGHDKLLASAVVILFWSLQHTMLPFVPDATYVVYRTITVMPVAITAVVLYLFVTRRRLLPLMIMHMVADVLAALSPLLLVRG